MNLTINNAALFQQHAFINGQWCDAEKGDRFDVTNPSTLEKIADVPNLGVAETTAAIYAADQALPAWRALTAKERSARLRAWYELIMANQKDLAKLMTSEQGKPLAEARGEVAYGASFIEWFAEEAKRVYGDVIPAHGPDKRIVTLKQPIGVVAAITPWNFPIAMITRKAGPALAAGCTIVVKPGEHTPLSALALAELSRQAGIPAGVFNVVTTLKSPVVGKVLCNDSRVRKLSFTGSTPVGKLLMRQCADTVKKSPWSWVATRPLSCSTMPIWTPRLPASWPPSSAMPVRPACAPIASWCRMASTTALLKSSTRRWQSSRWVTVSVKVSPPVR